MEEWKYIKNQIMNWKLATLEKSVILKVNLKNMEFDVDKLWY